MSGIKRTIKETDPDYEDVSVALPNKRHKAIENSGRNSPGLGNYFFVDISLPVRFIEIKCISTIVYILKKFMRGIS